MGNPSVPNQQRNEIRGKIGPREFVLEPSFKNVQAGESILGRSFIQIGMELREKRVSLTVTELANLVFVSQKDPASGESPKLSVNQIGNLLVKHGSFGALEMVSRYMAVALSGSEDLEDESSGEPGNGEARASQ